MLTMYPGRAARKPSRRDEVFGDYCISGTIRSASVFDAEMAHLYDPPRRAADAFGNYDDQTVLKDHSSWMYAYTEGRMEDDMSLQVSLLWSPLKTLVL